MNQSESKPTNRQVFQVEDKQQYDEQNITVDKPHVAATVWNLLITGTCIGLFCYVNTYFAYKLHKVVDGSVILGRTLTFSCDQYFCDRTMYNYMYYYTFYEQCNQPICTNTICSNYLSQCGSNQYYIDFNRYFACEPLCPNYFKGSYPKIMYLAYGLSISSAVLFALNILAQILSAIILNISAKQINRLQRFGLLLSFMWPSLKYYIFRKRTFWEDCDLNLKAMIIVDYLSAVNLSVIMAIYFWLYVIGTWLESKEVALFFILIGSLITHWLVCWSNGRTFWKVQQRFS